MLICDEILHCSLEAFHKLSRDEQSKWRIYIQEKWRRQAAEMEELKEQRSKPPAPRGRGGH